MTELTPTRGRGSCGDWRRDYEARRMTAAKAAELVQDGDTVVSTGGANWPYAVDEALAQRLRGMQCHVNVIPLNSVEEKALRGADKAAIERFMQELERRHISVTRRREMGDDIDGACGQLRRHYLADQAERQE